MDKKKIKDQNEQILECEWAEKNKNKAISYIEELKETIKEEKKIFKSYEESNAELAERVAPIAIELRRLINIAREKKKISWSYRTAFKLILKSKANRVYEYIAYQETLEEHPDANLGYSSRVLLGQSLKSKHSLRISAAESIFKKYSKEEVRRPTFEKIKRELHKLSKKDIYDSSYIESQLDAFQTLTQRINRTVSNEKFSPTSEGKKKLLEKIKVIKEEIQTLLEELNK